MLNTISAGNGIQHSIYCDIIAGSFNLITSKSLRQTFHKARDDTMVSGGEYYIRVVHKYWRVHYKYTFNTIAKNVAVIMNNRIKIVDFTEQ